jgi:hypothetical protein
MDNVGIVVDDLPTTIALFQEPGLELEGSRRRKMLRESPATPFGSMCTARGAVSA